MNGVFLSDIDKNQELRFVLKRVRPTPYNVHTRFHFSTNVKEFYEGSLELISRYSKSCIRTLPGLPYSSSKTNVLQQ